MSSSSLVSLDGAFMVGHYRRCFANILRWVPDDAYFMFLCCCSEMAKLFRFVAQSFPFGSIEHKSNGKPAASMDVTTFLDSFDWNTVLLVLQ